MGRWLLPIVLLLAAPATASGALTGTEWEFLRAGGTNPRALRDQPRFRSAASSPARLNCNHSRPLPRAGHRLRFRDIRSTAVGCDYALPGASDRSSGRGASACRRRLYLPAAAGAGSPSSSAADRRERGVAGGGRREPSGRLRSPDAATSTFQIGASALTRSISARAALNASPRCGAEAATITLGSDSGTVPTRCSSATARAAVGGRHLLADRAQLGLRHLRRRPRSRARAPRA